MWSINSSFADCERYYRNSQSESNSGRTTSLLIRRICVSSISYRSFSSVSSSSSRDASFSFDSSGIDIMSPLFYEVRLTDIALDF